MLLFRYNVDCAASAGLYGLAEGAFGTQVMSKSTKLKGKVQKINYVVASMSQNSPCQQFFYFNYYNTFKHRNIFDVGKLLFFHNRTFYSIPNLIFIEKERKNVYVR